MNARLQLWARRLKSEALTLFYVARHPDTPWYAKALAAFATAYAFSPIDLIPDFIPVLGYLDDLILLPLLIALAIKMVPRPVWKTCRQQALLTLQSPRESCLALIVILIIWLGLATLCGLWLMEATSIEVQ